MLTVAEALFPLFSPLLLLLTVAAALFPPAALSTDGTTSRNCISATPAALSTAATAYRGGSSVPPDVLSTAAAASLGPRHSVDGQALHPIN